MRPALSHRARLAGTWTLLLALLVVSCSDSSSPTGPGQGPDYTPVRIPQPSTGPIILHDNVVVIDSVVLRMASSAAEIDAGTYRFDILGSPVPLIEVDEVIVGPEGLGFMGIATSVSYGTQVVVQTTQAYLVDVIKEGSLDISEPLDFSALPPAPGSALAPFYYLAPGVMPVTVRITQIKNVDLCKLAKDAGLQGCPEGISLSLPSGYVDFTADGKYKFRKRCCLPPIDTFKVAISGSLVFDVTAKAVAKQAFSMGDEVVLRSLAVPLPLPYGANKALKTTMLVSLKAGWAATAEVEARVQSGIHMEAGVTIGGEWTFEKYDLTRGTPDHTGWRPIWDPTFNAEMKETSWAAQGSGFVRIYVRPDIQFIMLGLRGPRAGLEPNLKVTGTAGTEACQVRLTRSTDANVELFGHFFGLHWSTDTLKVPWPGTETDVIPPFPCPIGHLKVVTTTSGLSPDPDGYTVMLDGGDPKLITSNGSVMYSPLPPAPYSVELTGIAENCTTSVNPREINVSAGDPKLVSFPVVCTDPAGSPGSLQVNAATTGEDDGYTAVVDNDLGAGQALTIDGSTTFATLTSGNHSVELTDFGASCVVEGDNPRTVTIVQDATVSTDFVIACGLTVYAVTKGTNLDPDGYDVIVDGGIPTALADINGTLWLDIALGVHSVELTDVEDNCSVTGDNPRNVTAPGEETFDVSCTTPPGSVITYVMGGDLWQINPDGTGNQQLMSDPESMAWADWSPDGTRMAFMRVVPCGSRNCQTIFTADSDGSNMIQASHPAEYEYDYVPQWSPDGTSIVFHRRSDITELIFSIRTVDPDGSNETELLAVAADTPPFAELKWPTWTPDGRIVFAERVNDNVSPCVTSMKRIDADGSNEEELFGGLPCNEVRFHRVSPDGAQVLLPLVGAGDWECIQGTGGGTCLWVMGIDGSDPTNLTGAHFVNALFSDWSPDGSQIVLDAIGGVLGTSNWDVWLMDADGSNMTQVTSAGGHEVYPTWRTLP